MKRRSFLKLTSTGTAALLLTTVTEASFGKDACINLPDKASVKIGEKWFKMNKSGGRYTYMDIVLEFKITGNTTTMLISSPTQELNNIELKWPYHFSKSALALGDRWERAYGDLAWMKKSDITVSPWYLIVHDERQTICFGVKTGCKSLCSWHLDENNLVLDMNTISGGKGVLLGDRQLHAADIIFTKNLEGEDTFMTARRFCGIMCTNPKLPSQPVYGINDWYYAYGNNSYESIKLSTALIAELASNESNRPFSVIDAGWAQYSPYLPGDGSWNEDFSQPNNKFKDMHRLGDEIKRLGMRPGLWMRPLCARHDDKPSLLAPKIAGRNDFRRPILDPTIPENVERIKSYFNVYKQWGYEMVKHDFTTFDITGRWGNNMGDGITATGWSFNDQSKTNAEIILNLYKSLRDAAGDIYLIGCNTMSHLSAGIFELCRVGDDTSGKEWARTLKMGVNSLAFRSVQHNKFYATDGDCVGLTTEIAWGKNKQWLRLLSESGTPFFLSAQPEAMGMEQKKAIKEAFLQASKIQPVGMPLDWMKDPLPKKWILNNEVVTFDW